jgi:putative ABC transport system ATP-binding protein
MRVLQNVQKDGVTVMIITHERDIAHMTDRLVHLVDGRIAGDSPQSRLDPSEVVQDVEPLAPRPDRAGAATPVAVPG